MKMRPEVFERHYADIKAVLERIRDTGLRPLPGKPVDVDSLSMRDFWDVHQKVLIDRGNESHPMHSAEGVLDRVLEFTDQSPYFLYNDEDLDDSHIETAFRAMQRRWEDDRTSSPRP